MPYALGGYPLMWGDGAPVGVVLYARPARASLVWLEHAMPSLHGTCGASSAAEAATPTLAGCLPPTASAQRPLRRPPAAAAQTWHQLAREQHTLDRPLRQRLVRSETGFGRGHVFWSDSLLSVSRKGVDYLKGDAKG